MLKIVGIEEMKCFRMGFDVFSRERRMVGGFDDCDLMDLRSPKSGSKR